MWRARFVATNGTAGSCWPTTRTTGSPPVLNENSENSGPFTVIYKVSDGALTSTNTATLTSRSPRSTDAPVCATPQSGSTNEDVALNDSVVCTDVDSASLTYAKVGDPLHGMVVVNADGTFTYTPALNYNGPDSFTFKANDGFLDSNTATYNVTIGTRSTTRRRPRTARPARTRMRQRSRSTSGPSCSTSRPATRT